MMLISISDWLLQADRRIFTFINSEAALPAIDWFMLALRHAFTWIPLYAYILFWIFRYHKKQALAFILLTLVTFAVTDYSSASIFKPLFERLRPCFDPAIADNIRSLVGCGGRYGMPSSHASNHFGLAAFWIPAMSTLSGRKWHWLWLWALLIGYAQIYVGKHFPGDILVGALLGLIVGSGFAYLFRRWIAKKESSDQSPGKKITTMW